jgi:hypothetical protein
MLEAALLLVQYSIQEITCFDAYWHLLQVNGYTHVLILSLFKGAVQRCPSRVAYLRYLRPAGFSRTGPLGGRQRSDSLCSIWPWVKVRTFQFIPL